MSGFNLPPGCSVSDLPGNRPEDAAWEAAEEWALEELSKACLSLSEYRRAVLIGIAAVNAERKEINEAVNEAVGEYKLEQEMRAAEEGPRSSPL